MEELNEHQVLAEASRALSNPHLQELKEPMENELTLSRDEIKLWNLGEGYNEVIFSVTTQFQGE